MKPRSTFSTLIASLSLSLIALALPGCGSDDTPAARYGCSTKGPCPRDPAPSSTEAMDCETLSNDETCGAAFVAYSNCAYAAKMCDNAGLSDPTADSLATACNSDYATYTTCLQDKIIDSGAAGSN